MTQPGEPNPTKSQSSQEKDAGTTTTPPQIKVSLISMTTNWLDPESLWGDEGDTDWENPKIPFSDTKQGPLTLRSSHIGEHLSLPNEEQNELDQEKK